LGRTIPSFRIAILLEEKRWKLYRQYLRKKEQKIFKHMFSIAYLFSSASSYAANPIRINPILFSIALYHHKKISSLDKNRNESFFFQSSLFTTTITTEMKKENETYSSSSNLFPYDNIITKEIDSWKNYADCLRKQDRDLFYKMLNSCYKYSPAITVQGKEYSTTSALMSILLEHHKELLLQNKINNI